LSSTLVTLLAISSEAKKHLASRYVFRKGIPLVEDPRKLPAGDRIEDRISVLENSLREYYINDYFLDKLGYYYDINIEETKIRRLNKLNEYWKVKI
jgi:hypothetical protein